MDSGAGSWHKVWSLVSILFLDLPPYTSGKRLIGSWVAQELKSERPGRTPAEGRGTVCLWLWWQLVLGISRRTLPRAE